MPTRTLRPGIHWVGALDWDRRLFDELVPTPDGTTYNAYLVRGSQGTALIDTVEPHFMPVLLERLRGLGVERLDYVVSNHAEQDHSGGLPEILNRFPECQLLCTPKAQPILLDLMELPAGRIRPVEDGSTVSLGDRTLRFIHFPWVHWPETMLTYAVEDAVLFPCDLFGSHLAPSDVTNPDLTTTLSAAKRYYAQIMMPFRAAIAKNLPKVRALDLSIIAPSHGPVFRDPSSILGAYEAWIADAPRNRATLAYASMHESTRKMMVHLAEALVERGVTVDLFNLAEADLGKLAMSLVDAATIVLGSPTVSGGAHPLVAYAAYIANLLRPKARWGAVVGSFSWGGKMTEQLTGLMPNLKLEMMDCLIAKGLPKARDLSGLDRLADTIAEKHKGLA